ncbi:RagB/SusD family nutrient uptake outer membrane protein [Pedobacter foliorum]|uniref:RagB/SusD family nutrient uptake outer membrane protein n=1 Tax=Pedobacter foliorum TaxID=2739058 RepID=UPI001564FD66|nr:RagB/SusD family nutrient uptake outer membrane protein [Pedobacter foliorum]NRF38359.1 RagB/SusD family nutrient uptake outer membrane protein [Pedobacter foliorum]
MNISKTWIYIIAVLLIIPSCKKSDFLNKKPSSLINIPSTLTDFQLLLDNTIVMNTTGGLSQVSADDHEISSTNYQTISTTERNAYIWDKVLYGAEIGIQDWNAPYQQVFYANVVLEGLAKSDSATSAQAQTLKGWALFARAFAFYDLTRNFCKAYDDKSADQDLGIPLRLSSSIDYLKPRSTLQQSFNQIFDDLNASIALLPSERPSANLNRPSKIAAYALLSRVYLDMRNYKDAEYYADQTLTFYSTLIDYNTVNQTSTTPFSRTNDELICNYSQVPTYGFLTGSHSTYPVRISSSLIKLYSENDLRLKVYYSEVPEGGYYKKRGYNGMGFYPFTGLATDEQYLIKAECLARRGETKLAMDKLNLLLINRFDKRITFKPLTALSSEEALSKILLERRKELVWRNLRWHDIKRLNKGGANITLTRTLNGIGYTLPPNDARYVFSIPNDEIALSGIEQNNR